MLATLSAVRKGYYCSFEHNPAVRIPIPPQRPPSESFTSAALPPASNVIYKYMSISVIKEDCLLSALAMEESGFDRWSSTWLRFVSQIYLSDVYSCLKERSLIDDIYFNHSQRALVGGYRKGDGFQKENIFRRSNYFLSLDDPTNPRCPTYPIAEFSGIYTPDITVFRNPEDSGYAFRQIPFTVDFIAVAAYRYVTQIAKLCLFLPSARPNFNPHYATDRMPKLKNNCLSTEDAARMRGKIEAIFAITLHKGHDSLLLSAGLPKSSKSYCRQVPPNSVT
ncbi:hypothetical protein BC936DRAFT_142373 [Jimgerdemannia flammicorona]|uniref:Microbial-type PARG catalytic domain-containing protein n=1 Tax=Jimgerdemannia flammicorona TaxID=994334 RepID=A0A433A0F9_9FUNG|nr:hypothetical protein BC936DRAFT_142373 [Jimgerdemannia flammicorona]